MIQLHNHSTGSWLDGYGLPEQIVARCKELGNNAVAITDHGNCILHYPFYKEAKKQGINPILGIEAYFVPDRHFRGKEHRYHITLLAKNNTGYSNLMQMVTEANLTGFYYKPRLDWELFKQYGEGIICLTGCPNGILHKKLQDGFDPTEELVKLKQCFKDVYIEVMPTKYMTHLEGLCQLAENTNTELVATCDCHYPSLEEQPVQDVMMCIGSKYTMDDPNRWTYEEKIYYQMTDEEVKELFKERSQRDFSGAIENSQKIADMCHVELGVVGKVLFPYEGDKVALLEHHCAEGWTKRKLPMTDEYRERYKREIDIIKQKDFVDYFLINHDYISWSKSQGILVGPARGSAAGSLVSYLLGITEVDPLKFGLIFERFIDINRQDPPDIDTDFEDARRHEVKEYLSEKYGEKKVATLATFSTFKGKVCFDDIGRIFKIPFDVIEDLKSLLIERSGGDSRASFTVADTFVQFPRAAEIAQQYPEFKYSAGLEGQYRNLSSHAAGVIVGNVDLNKHFTLMKARDEIVLGADKKSAEARGFLKLDVLGLKYLTFLSRARKLIYKRHNEWIDYYNLPLDNPKVYKGFQDGKLFGIFQFEGFAVGSIAKQMKPKNFEELVHINALSRPGCLNSGATTRFLNRKTGELDVPKAHPIYEELTRDTYGEIIYQEQVMMAMRNIGLMSWEDTAEIRKLISKSQGEEKFDTFKKKFLAGGKENGYEEKDLEEIWNNVNTFGSWAFNKSHSVSYSFLAYWGMYIKVYYPEEFYSAFCELEDKDDKLNKIIREMKKEGIEFRMPEINTAKKGFSIQERGIMAGIIDIKNIGDKTADKIIKEQPYANFEDFRNKCKVSDRVVESLRKAGAFRNLGMETSQLSLFEPIYNHHPTPEEMMEVMPYGIDLHLQEKYGSQVNELFPGYRLTTLEDMVTDKRSKVCMPVIIKERNLRDINEIGNLQVKGDRYTEYDKKHLNEFCNFILEDDSEYSYATIHRKKYPNFKKEIWSNTEPGAVYAVCGTTLPDKQMLFIDTIKCLTQKS